MSLFPYDTKSRAWIGVAAGLFAIGAAASAGCHVDIGDGGTEVPGPPNVEPKQVPSSPEKVDSTSTCVDLRKGERFVSLSPEGHAWFVRPGSPSSVRVLDAFGDEMNETLDDVEIADISDAQAWSSSDAALIGDDMLLRFDDFARIELNAPSGFSTPARLCGDLGVDGMLVSNGVVFERRTTEWWQWDSGSTGDAAPENAIRYDGQCRSANDVMWLTSADGTLTRVDGTQFTRPVKFEKMVDAAGTADVLAVLETDRLWTGSGTGDDWQPWVFSGAVPGSLSASGGFVWMTSGDQLLRFDGAAWAEVDSTMTESIDRIAAHADGVWLIGATTACHESFGPSLRVDGVRSYARDKELEYEISVTASDGDEDLAGDVDGEAFTLTLDSDTGAMVGIARLEAVGWHTITISAPTSLASRSFYVKRMPDVDRSWETDIKPIYEANCTGSKCHRSGSSDPPDLGSLEAWTQRSDLIRAKVIETKTMPPAANVGPDWGDDQIGVIRDWLEGGMLP